MKRVTNHIPTDRGQQQQNVSFFDSFFKSWHLHSLQQLQQQQSGSYYEYSDDDSSSSEIFSSFSSF